MKDTFQHRLYEAMQMRDLKASELADLSGVSRPLISIYLQGKYEAKQNALYKLAKALDVSEAWLMGYDAPKERIEQKIETERIPLLGEISCGVPKYADEDFEAYVQVGANVQCDFALRARGDSMTGARINDGDIVFIRKQSIVQSGEIAAVIIGEEATLKRVFIYDNKVILQAENPKYPPLIYVGDELEQVEILGKAVAFQSDVR